MIKITKYLILISILSLPVYSQFGYEAITGYDGDKLDTNLVEETSKISEMTGGLIEEEIDPDEYIVGPGDEFFINIIQSSTKTITQSVNPEGKLLLRGIGIINLKDKSLNESYTLIKEKLNSVFNSAEILVALNNIKKFKVTVSGNIIMPVTLKATSRDRVSEVINRAGGMKKNSSLRHIKLIRDEKEYRIDLLDYYYKGNKESNPYVNGGDHIIVQPYLENITLEINGEVPNPIEVEYVEGDKLSDLIKLAQGFLPSSDLDSVFVFRYDGQIRKMKKLVFDLSDWREKDLNSKLSNNIDLEIGDRIFIRKKSDWVRPSYIKILGEVKYPGKYALDQGNDKVYDIIQRAGGFTDNAYLEATTLIRQKELEKEDLELERLKTIPPSEMSESEFKYFQARKQERRGVMAISFNRIIEDPNSIDNIYLIHKDSIVVPETIDFVNIQGRVNNPGNVKFNPEYDYLDYIRLAGGFGYRAEEDETFITKSKGEQFLAENYDYDIEPGDTILVPPEDEQTFYEIFKETLNIATQLVTVAGVIITIVRLQ